MEERENIKISTLNNGATARLKNKRINVVEREKYVLINFRFVDKDPETPACWHQCHKGKIRETNVKMSHRAMEAMVVAYMEYKRKKAIEKMAAKNQKNNEAKDSAI